jgi:hypothetical protein
MMLAPIICNAPRYQRPAAPTPTGRVIRTVVPGRTPAHQNPMVSARKIAASSAASRAYTSRPLPLVPLVSTK